MEQLHAQFTENVLAEKDVECDRTACDTNGGIIPAGQRRYYVFPKLDKMVSHMAQENTAAKIAISITAAKKIL